MVRALAIFAAITLTSLYAAAHFLLESAGGPFGRNWSADLRLNGRISPM